MASLNDRTFDRRAWIRLVLVVAVLATFGGVIYGSTVAHHEFIQKPRMMAARHTEPVGTPGMATTQITNMGSEAVPVLLDDVKTDKPLMERQKSLELLSGIDDPRVLPVLIRVLGDDDIGMRLAALAGLARRGQPDAFEAVWKYKDIGSDLMRHRVFVAVGLVAGERHLPVILDEADRLAGTDQHLLYWAAGHTQRRKDSAEKSKYARPVAAPIPENAADMRKLQGDIDEIKRRIAVKEGDRLELAKELARLTSVNFTTWDYGKQLAHQTIAISGPGAIRSLARIDRDPKPPAHAVPLRLDRKRVREE